MRNLAYTPHVTIGAAIPADVYPMVRATLSQQSVRLNATADSLGLSLTVPKAKWHVARRRVLRGTL